MSDQTERFEVQASVPLLDEHEKDTPEKDEANKSDHTFWYTLLALFFGWNTGLLLQAVAVHANAMQVISWRGVPPTDSMSELARYYALSVLRHADVAVCVLLWVRFMSCRSSSATQFRVGMHILMGVICGSSAAWMGLDYLLGFPVRMATMILTLASNLTVCLLALKFYQPEEEEEEKEDNGDGYMKDLEVQ